MKRGSDPRHIQRIRRIQQLFAWDFAHGDNSPQDMDFTEITPIVEKIEPINEAITLAAPMWPIDKINKTDLAILRNAVYELLIDPVNPPKVVVDESIEIAKDLGSESSPSFINGALAKLITDNKIKT
jgi:N utilization substance protein B